MNKKMSRRNFLAATGVSAAGTVLAACTTPTAPPAEIIKETELVTVKETEVVKETVEVEVESIVEITATTATGPTNALGVTLPINALPLEEQLKIQPVGTTGGGYGHIMESLYNRAFEHNGGYECLTSMNNDYEIIGTGCESFEMAEDGSYWDFKLREDLMFSDGTPVTADAWVFTMQRSLANAYDFAWFYFDIKNASAVATGTVGPEELGMEAVDDYTLRIYTEKPTPYLPAIGTWFGVAAPQAYDNSLGDTNNWALDPERYISSGPFTLTKFDRGINNLWEHNTAYTGPREMYFEQIVETTLPVGLAAYMAGDLQQFILDASTPPAEVQLVNSNPMLRAETTPLPGTATWYIGFNSLKETLPDTNGKDVPNPFLDKNVRYAFCKAIDKDNLNATLMRGFSNAAAGILPAGFPNYNAANKDLDVNVYDPEAAKQLLADAGFPDGAGFPVFDMWIRQPSPDMTNWSQALQQRWQENLGVKVELHPGDFQSYTAAAHKDKIAAIYFVAYSMDYFDPATFLNVFVADSVGGREENDNVEWTDAYLAANGNLNLEERLEQMAESETALIEAANQFFLYVPFSFDMWNCNIDGWAQEPNKDGYKFHLGGAPGCFHAYQGLYWNNSNCREGLG